MGRRFTKSFDAGWTSSGSLQPPLTEARQASESNHALPQLSQSTTEGVPSFTSDSFPTSVDTESAPLQLTPARSTNSSRQSLQSTSTRTRKFSKRFDSQWTLPTPDTPSQQQGELQDSRIDEEETDLSYPHVGLRSPHGYRGVAVRPQERPTDGTIPMQIQNEGPEEGSRSSDHSRGIQSASSYAGSTVTPNYSSEAGEAVAHPPTGYVATSRPTSNETSSNSHSSRRPRVLPPLSETTNDRDFSSVPVMRSSEPRRAR